jgi:hypothetical protein
VTRIIDIDVAPDEERSVTMRVGEVLRIAASGALVSAGNDVVQMLGAFQAAVTGPQGQVVTPCGPPNTVLCQANRPGAATLEIKKGDPFHAPRSSLLTITVEP